MFFVRKFLLVATQSIMITNNLKNINFYLIKAHISTKTSEKLLNIIPRNFYTVTNLCFNSWRTYEKMFFIVISIACLYYLI
jgi:hypothetical protein